MSSVPIVVLHIGTQPYFTNCVLLNSKHNPVIVIGDIHNKHITNVPNVEHYEIHTLVTQELNEFKKCFFNYSTNSASYEFLCFARVFYMKRLMELKGLDAIFHVDSDCIMLERLDKVVPLIRKTHSIAYSLEKSDNPLNMVGCIHNGLLTLEFCNQFVQLCFDIYLTKTKLHLIEPKVKWHVSNKQAGGICDMTLYHLLASEKLIDVFDLNQVIEVDGIPCTFDHNINSAVGYRGPITYKMNGSMKQVEKEGDHFFITEVGTHQKIRALTFHFQGGAKQHMLSVYKKGHC
jgi:hypothetical protein